MAKIDTPAAWVGWVYFAASLLILIGAMQIVQGLGAIFNPDFFVATSEEVFVFNIATWGWLHLAIGIIAISSGIGTFTGAVWARILALIVTAFAMLSSIAFITVFPFWSIFVLLVGAVVIYALTVQGDGTKSVTK